MLLASEGKDAGFLHPNGIPLMRLAIFLKLVSSLLMVSLETTDGTLETAILVAVLQILSTAKSYDV